MEEERKSSAVPEIVIDPALKKIYPWIRLGCLHFTAKVLPPDEIFGRYLEEEVIPRVTAETAGKAWGDIPGVRGSRRAYRAFGWEPSRHRVSSEALIRRIRRGSALYRINTVVDVNNMLSATSGLSLGCYDLAALEGPFLYRRAEEEEGYEGIGRGPVRLGGLPVLCDSRGPFGSSLSDSVRAAVTLDTEDILVVLHCFDGETDLEDWLDISARSFEAFAGAENITAWIV